MDIAFVSVIIGGLAAVVAVLLLALCLPRRSCPGCNSELPRFRKPSNVRQALLGGWTCPSCSSRIARNGTLLPD